MNQTSDSIQGDSTLRDASAVFAVGMMSGTSADGIDVALLETDGQAVLRFVAAKTFTYQTSIRQLLLRVASEDLPLVDVMRCERMLTELHVNALKAFLVEIGYDSSRISVIGFHGHTIRHLGSESLTWQLGDSSYLAAQVGIPVVGDLRRFDCAMGGQGAPLAPLYHQQLTAACEKPTAVLNLGGVANITWIGRDGRIIAGDTGPGCGLLDAWMMRHCGESMDRDGKRAAAGCVDATQLTRALCHPYFQRPLPKSADRYDFADIDMGNLSVEDGAATLTAVTVAGVKLALEGLPEYPRSVWVTGGGAANPTLMGCLRASLGHAETIAAIGGRPDSLEAECFAWLAVRHLRGLVTSVPETTGCREANCGGVLAGGGLNRRLPDK